MTVRSNIAGTMASTFSIGKRGPTIFQGIDNPNIANQIGLNGDLYVQIGTTPTLYQFRVTTWVDVTGEVFSRTPVLGSYAATNSDFYLGMRGSGPCTVQLPAGQFGKKFIIKDEIGQVSPNSPITIQASGQETIDGSSTIRMDTPRSSLTMVYGVEWHII
ncbi:MAG: hypothetical protein EOO77_10745 [Oxalobacteraceae bacterium]|nr:MAG: hypothetical protein EOO77_10745 [Oxalobacteraceae bacterium]